MFILISVTEALLLSLFVFLVIIKEDSRCTVIQ